MEFYQVDYDRKDPRAKQWEKLNFALRRIFNRLGETDVTAAENEAADIKVHSGLGGLDYASAGHTGFVPSTRIINTTHPLKGGASLASDPTLYIEQGEGSTLDADLVDTHHARELAPNAGFENRTDSTISFDDGTRTLTLAPVGTSYNIYWNGVKYVKTTETATITDTEGLWFIYFDSSGVIQASQTVWDILATVQIAVLYWDATNSKQIFLGDERHGPYMDQATHKWAHNTIGSRYESGLAVSGSTSGSGNSDADAEIGVTGGEIHDEDIEISIVDDPTPTEEYEQILTLPAQIPIYYRDGATGWLKKTADNFPLVQGSVYGGTIPGWNDENGGDWTVTELSNTAHVAIWIYASNSISEPVLGILGQREDLTLANAQANNTLADLSMPNFPTLEFKIIARLIFQGNTGYSNTPKARLREIVDYRQFTTLPSGAISITSHASLTDLAYAAAGHTGFLEDADQAVGDRIAAAAAKTTPVDADVLGISDSAASNILKKVTWANIKATLKTYFDTIYSPILSATVLGGLIHGYTGKSSPVATDEFVIADSADSYHAKALTLANLYTYLKTAFDSVYQAILTGTNFGAFIAGLSAKATPVDADLVPLTDSAAANLEKYVTWANIKATLKAYFDTLYQVILTAANLGDFIVALSAKTTPVDGDTIVLSDSADGDDAKKVTWANVKATLKSYFDTLYQAILTAANFGDFIVALSAKTTPVDGDTIALSDSADGDDSKKVTWANVKATLKSYFDTVYDALGDAAAAAAAAIAAHVLEADPHTQYQKESEKSAASGYASLDGSALVPVAELATGTPDGTKFLRDDRSWQVPPGAAGASVYTDTFDATTDWGSASGGLYTITFTHSLSKSTLVVQVWDTGTGELVIPESTIIVDADNVSISVSETPDNRFAGRIVIIY